AEGIAAYRFARVAQNYARTSARIDTEKMALDSSSDEKYNTYKETYSKVKTATVGKFDKYRPEKAYKNLKSEGKLNYEVETKKSKFGYKRTTVKAVMVNGQRIPIDSKKFTDRFNPLKTYKQRMATSAKIQTHVDFALKGEKSYVRSSVAKKIRADLDIKLRWYEKGAGEYRGKKADEARLALEKEATERNSPKPDVTETRTSTLKEDTQNTIDKQKACDQDPKCLKEQIDKNKPAATVDEAINKVGSEDWLKKFAGTVSTTYAIAAPICMVYDGSIVNMGPTIDENLDGAVKTYNSLQTASNHQIGDPEVPHEFITAMNSKVGEGNSVPDQYMRGDKPNTTGEASPQADIVGNYNLINSMFGSSPPVDTISGFADNVCPPLSDPKTGLGIGFLWIAIKTVGGLGVGGIFAQGAEEGVKITTETVIKESLKKSFTKGFLQGLFFKEGVKKAETRSVGDFAGKFAGNFATTEVATIVARMYVINKSLAIDGGRTSGVGQRDIADMGAVQESNEEMRKMNFGKPMTNKQLAAVDQQTIAYLNNKESEKPAYDRYFATSNPKSLISRMSYAKSDLKQDPINSVVKFASLKNIANNFSSIFNKKVYAEDQNGSQYYNIVQWGWTEDEEKLIDSKETYGLAENAAYLDAHQAEISEIESKYGPCFDKTMGTLLSEGLIMRTEDGDVKEADGDCAPNNLGPNNPKYQDLVFRWRIDKRNQNVLDHNLGIQEPTNDEAADDPTSCTPSKGLDFSESNMKPNAILLAKCISAKWPEIETIGGYRPDDPYPDHPGGYAIDVMIPQGCVEGNEDGPGGKLGDEIKAFVWDDKKNRKGFAVTYIIWKDTIHTASDQTGHRLGRAGCTEGHYDHVHITLNESGKSPYLSSNPFEDPTNAIDTNDLYSSSADIPCADGTNDAGLEDGYHDKKKVQIRLCSLSSIKPKPGHDKILVNSRVSETFQAMGKAAKQDGVTLTAGENFRTMKEQEYYYNCMVTKACNEGRRAAVPGTSNHQMGLALDMGEGIDWLNKNGKEFGVSAKVSGEPWHWSVGGY
ncbi:M15 family metallopeptidase, partial [Candidatus Saccharibacteria bacterium]|nr:M15 family metallopeptidase [Candidatus Saccharibacteria bacterium]